MEKQVEMIEQLLKDKDTLQKKLHEQAQSHKDIDATIKAKTQQMQQDFEEELRKNKDAWLASEKVRRQKWEQDKIQEIRSQTIKGLEPEIQRIVERNKEELRKAHELHVQELRDKK